MLSHIILDKILDKVLAFIPPVNHWFIDCIVMITKGNPDDEESDEYLRQMLSQYPGFGPYLVKLWRMDN